MIVRVAVSKAGDPRDLLRTILEALKDPDVLQIVVHRPGAEVRTTQGEEFFVNAGGRWESKRALPQADGAGV